jgi:hypothetical protein
VLIMGCGDYDADYQIAYHFTRTIAATADSDDQTPGSGPVHQHLAVDGQVRLVRIGLQLQLRHRPGDPLLLRVSLRRFEDGGDQLGQLAGAGAVFWVRRLLSPMESWPVMRPVLTLMTVPPLGAGWLRFSYWRSTSRRSRRWSCPLR